MGKRMRDRLSSQYNEWWDWFGWRTKHFLSQIWFVVERYLVIVAIFSTSFVMYLSIIYRGKIFPLELAEEVDIVATSIFIILPIGLAATLFIMLFVLSLSESGRAMADNIFKYQKFTELEKFKNEMKGEIASINERLENIEVMLKRLTQNYEIMRNATSRRSRSRSRLFKG